MVVRNVGVLPHHYTTHSPEDHTRIITFLFNLTGPTRVVLRPALVHEPQCDNSCPPHTIRRGPKRNKKKSVIQELHALKVRQGLVQWIGLSTSTNLVISVTGAEHRGGRTWAFLFPLNRSKMWMIEKRNSDAK
jgi:hypothetical protein